MKIDSLWTVFIYFIITFVYFVVMSRTGIFFVLSIKESFASALIFTLLDLLIWGIGKVVGKKK